MQPQTDGLIRWIQTGREMIGDDYLEWEGQQQAPDGHQTSHDLAFCQFERTRWANTVSVCTCRCDCEYNFMSHHFESNYIRWCVCAVRLCHRHTSPDKLWNCVRHADKYRAPCSFFAPRRILPLFLRGRNKRIFSRPFSTEARSWGFQVAAWIDIRQNAQPEM